MSASELLGLAAHNTASEKELEGLAPAAASEGRTARVRKAPEVFNYDDRDADDDEDKPKKKAKTAKDAPKSKAKGASPKSKEPAPPPPKKAAAAAAPKKKAPPAGGGGADAAKAMEGVRKHIEACGGGAELVKGWRAVKTPRRNGDTAGSHDWYFFSDEGQRFRSRAEIARHLGLAPGEVRGGGGGKKKSSGGGASSSSEAPPKRDGPLRSASVFEIERLLTSRSSKLAHAPLAQHVICWEVFSSLEAHERAALAALLPEGDRDGGENGEPGEDALRNAQLAAAVRDWQEQLESGEFEPDAQEALALQAQQAERKMRRQLAQQEAKLRAQHGLPPPEKPPAPEPVGGSRSGARKSAPAASKKSPAAAKTVVSKSSAGAAGSSNGGSGSGGGGSPSGGGGSP